MALFVAVVKNQSFSKTADQLNIAQSSLSRKISELESHLGVKLIHRTTRKLQLTEFGQFYFDKAIAIVDEFERTHDELSLLQTEPAGVLKMSVLSEFALQWLTALLPKFYEKYPKIALQIDVSPHKVDLLGGQVDMVVRAGLPNEPTYIAHSLTEVQFFVYASNIYLQKFGNPTIPDALSQHFCLAFTGQTTWQLTQGTQAQTFAINALYQSNSFEFLKNLTVQGLGISLLPTLSNMGKTHTDLVRILPDWQGVSAPIVILTATRLLPIKVRCMVDFLKEQVIG